MGSRRSGISLIEALVAVALSGALLVGVYRGLEMSAKLQRVGRDRAEGDAAIAGALCLIERCILESSYERQPRWADSAWNYDRDDDRPQRLSAQDLELIRGGLRQACVGGSASLVLAVSETAGGEGARFAASTAYAFWSGPRGFAELPPNLRRAIAAVLQERPAPAVGLFGARLAVGVSATGALAGDWEVLRAWRVTDEITDFRLRYLDRGVWRHEWRSDVAPPQAIEISAAGIRRDARVTHRLSVAAGGLGGRW